MANTCLLAKSDLKETLKYDTYQNIKILYVLYSKKELPIYQT